VFERIHRVLGKNDNEGLSKHRENGIAKPSRNMTNGFECIIMKVCVSKHREDGTAKGSRNVLNGIWSIMNVCVYIFMVVCVWLVLVMFYPRVLVIRT